MTVIDLDRERDRRRQRCRAHHPTARRQPIEQPPTTVLDCAIFLLALASIIGWMVL